jgi:hypothetical protein
MALTCDRPTGTGVEFELSPPVGYFRLNIFGEIVKASGFDADDL